MVAVRLRVACVIARAFAPLFLLFRVCQFLSLSALFRIPDAYQ